MRMLISIGSWSILNCSSCKGVLWGFVVKIKQTNFDKHVSLRGLRGLLNLLGKGFFEGLGRVSLNYTVFLRGSDAFFF